MPVSTTIEHDTNPMPAQCWYTVTGAGPATPMQYRGVLHAGVYTTTDPISVKCWASAPALASVDLIPGKASCWLGAPDYNARCRPIHDTPTQCRLECWSAARNGAVTLVQARPSIATQRMSTSRKIYAGCSFFSCTKARGIQYKRWIDVGEVP